MSELFSNIQPLTSKQLGDAIKKASTKKVINCNSIKPEEKPPPAINTVDAMSPALWMLAKQNIAVFLDDCRDWIVQNTANEAIEQNFYITKLQQLNLL